MAVMGRIHATVQHMDAKVRIIMDHLVSKGQTKENVIRETVSAMLLNACIISSALIDVSTGKDIEPMELANALIEKINFHFLKVSDEVPHEKGTPAGDN